MNFEHNRKLLHFLLSTAALLIIYFSYTIVGKSFTIAIFLSLLLFSIFFDYLRIEANISLPLYKDLIREKESHRFCGLTFSLIALVLIIALFDFSIFLPAFAMACYGDMIAALIGKNFGKRKIHNGKTLEGSLAALILNAMLAMVASQLFLLPLLLYLLMALFSTVIELYTNNLDDNFSITFLTATVGYLLAFFF